MSMREAFHIPEEDLIQYALGTLKDTQMSQFTAHISLCNECRGALANFQVELASFAAVQPLAELPAGARDRFMARLSSDQAPESKFVQMRNKSKAFNTLRSFQQWLESPVPFRIVSGALAAALLYVGYDDLSHVHQIRQMQPEMARFERQAAELTELKEFLHGTNTQQVSLHDRPVINKAPEGHAIYAFSTGKLVFTASNLPQPPAGKAYELWVLPLSGSAPVPAGVFKPDLQGNAAVIFPQIPPNVQAGAFGVTIEDEAGATKPTLPIVLSGQ
jgi:anti-sigma-K factor RskA